MKLVCRRCRAEQHVAACGEALGLSVGGHKLFSSAPLPGPGLPRSGDGMVFCHRPILLIAAQGWHTRGSPGPGGKATLETSATALCGRYVIYNIIYFAFTIGKRQQKLNIAQSSALCHPAASMSTSNSQKQNHHKSSMKQGIGAQELLKHACSRLSRLIIAACTSDRAGVRQPIHHACIWRPSSSTELHKHDDSLLWPQIQLDSHFKVCPA